MKNLDLEKWIIILSLLLIPAAAYWVVMLQEQLDSAKSAIALAKGPRGPISECYELERRIDETKRELKVQGGAATQAGTYFETRMVNANSGLPRSAIQIAEQKPQTVKARRGRGPGYQDVSVKITFQGGKALLQRSFINAFIVNSESQSPIWKLRALKIVNKEFQKRQKQLPTGEIPDEWMVRSMVFARRKPLGTGGKK